MSLELPASLEREIERYAKAEHLSLNEAAVKLLKEVLTSKMRRKRAEPPTDEEWRSFERLIPGYAIFSSLPDGTIEEIARASKRTRAEKLARRG